MCYFIWDNCFEDGFLFFPFQFYVRMCVMARVQGVFKQQTSCKLTRKLAVIRPPCTHVRTNTRAIRQGEQIILIILGHFRELARLVLGLIHTVALRQDELNAIDFVLMCLLIRLNVSWIHTMNPILKHAKFVLSYCSN